MPVLCAHWSEDKSSATSGVCAVGEQGGRPSISYCANECQVIVPTDPNVKVPPRVNCESWSECGHANGGCCIIGEANGHPTIGYCEKRCGKRKPLRLGAEPSPASKPGWGWTKRMAQHWKDASNFAAALTSRRYDVSKPKQLEIVMARFVSCHGDEKEQKPCTARKFSEKKQFHYCGECRCGDKTLARVSEYGSTPDRPSMDLAKTKLTFVVLTCPRSMPGFANSSKEAI